MRVCDLYRLKRGDSLEVKPQDAWRKAEFVRVGSVPGDGWGRGGSRHVAVVRYPDGIQSCLLPDRVRIPRPEHARRTRRDRENAILSGAVAGDREFLAAIRSDADASSNPCACSHGYRCQRCKARERLEEVREVLVAALLSSRADG